MSLTPEQEIRARALDAAVTLMELSATEALDIAATMFVPFIESGSLPEPAPPPLKRVK